MGRFDSDYSLVTFKETDYWAQLRNNDNHWIVDTDGATFYVVLKDDRVFIAPNGRHNSWDEAWKHATRLNKNPDHK